MKKILFFVSTMCLIMQAADDWDSIRYEGVYPNAVIVHYQNRQKALFFSSEQLTKKSEVIAHMQNQLEQIQKIELKYPNDPTKNGNERFIPFLIPIYNSCYGNNQ